MYFPCFSILPDCVSLINDSNNFSPGLNPVILIGLLYFSEKSSIKSFTFKDTNSDITVSPDFAFKNGWTFLQI